MNRKFLVITFCALMLSGCVSQNTSQYYWGEYEKLLYDMYHKPGEATPALQIEKLNLDIQKAQDSGKPVHPGLYAHLGFMYAIDGQSELSIQAFMKEKELFPDSAILVDGIMQRAESFKKPVQTTTNEGK